MIRLALIITRSDVVGGANVHVRDLARGLVERGFAPTVLVGGSGPYLDDLAAHGVPFEVVAHLGRAVRPAQDLRAYLALRAALARLRPALVTAHTSKAGALGRLAARSLGIPVVYTPHCWAFSDDGLATAAAYRLAERLLASGPGTIVDVSHHERRLALAKGIGSPDRHVTIHNGIPDVPPTLLADPGVEPPTLLTVARFERQKDHATLVDALARVADLPWRAQFVGVGPLESRTRAAIVAAGLAGRVQFLGARRDVASCYAGAQAFVLMSRWESLPLTVLEAMRGGLPVVAADVGGIGEAVDDGVSGFLVPPGDGPRLADALRTVLTDPSLRVRLGTYGRERFRQVFSHERMLDRVAALYAELATVITLPADEVAV